MDKILQVKKLKVSFRTVNGTVKAVRDISFDLERGETLAIVGESGSGKSVTSKAILGILAGNAIIEGGEIAEGDEMHVKNGEVIEEAIASTAGAHYKITSIDGAMIYKHSVYFTAAIMNGETVVSQKTVPLTIFVRLVDVDGIEIGGGDDFGEVIL